MIKEAATVQVDWRIDKSSEKRQDKPKKYERLSLML